MLVLFTSNSFSKSVGEGELKLNDNMIKYFHQYLKGKGNQSPMIFTIAIDGSYATYWYCPQNPCTGSNPQHWNRLCEQSGGVECKIFAKGRYIKWKNGINKGKGKDSKISSKQSFSELKARLAKLGFVEDGKLKKDTSSNSASSTYELKGKRSIALSWDGYSSLIAGTVSFDEKNYKGSLSLPLPNNDGNCTGIYLLQTGGKGTWQINCTNDMGAAGTLKWAKNSGVTGVGRDYKDKKVKFTVSKKNLN